MTTNVTREPRVVEEEIVKTEMERGPWYRNVSWGAIWGGAVIALLVQFALEMLGVAIGVAAIEPGEDTLGPEFTTAIVVWITTSALIALFTGGLVTGRLSGSKDPVSGVMQGIVMMGVATFVTMFILMSSVTATVRGVTNTISDGLSFVGASAADVSDTVANAVTVRDETLDDIRAEAEELLAPDASLTSLRLALDDYLLEDEPGDDTRQALIDALVTQTTLTQAEAAERVDMWMADFDQAVTRFEEEATVVADEVADVVAATAGIIFLILVAGAFAAGAGGFVGVTELATSDRFAAVTRRRETTGVRA